MDLVKLPIWAVDDGPNATNEVLKAAKQLEMTVVEIFLREIKQALGRRPASIAKSLGEYRKLPHLLVNRHDDLAWAWGRE